MLNPMFGERLKYARERAGLNQADLARKAGGLTGAAVSQLESGVSKGPRPENLAALARVLGVDIYWLATGEGDIAQIRESTSDSTPVEPSTESLMLAELIELFLSVDGYKGKRLFLDAARMSIAHGNGK